MAWEGRGHRSCGGPVAAGPVAGGLLLAATSPVAGGGAMYWQASLTSGRSGGAGGTGRALVVARCCATGGVCRLAVSERSAIGTERSRSPADQPRPPVDRRPHSYLRPPRATRNLRIRPRPSGPAPKVLDLRLSRASDPLASHAPPIRRIRPGVPRRPSIPATPRPVHAVYPPGLPRRPSGRDSCIRLTTAFLRTSRPRLLGLPPGQPTPVVRSRLLCLTPDLRLTAPRPGPIRLWIGVPDPVL